MIKLTHILFEGEKEYPELGAFKSKFFSTPLVPESSNIGEWIKFNKWNKSMGLMYLLPYKIMHIQKIYDGSLTYRVENQLNKFGMVAKFDEVTIISVEDAKKWWVRNIERIMGKYIEFEENWYND